MTSIKLLLSIVSKRRSVIKVKSQLLFRPVNSTVQMLVTTKQRPKVFGHLYIERLSDLRVPSRKLKSFKRSSKLLKKKLFLRPKEIKLRKRNSLSRFTRRKMSYLMLLQLSRPSLSPLSENEIVNSRSRRKMQTYRLFAVKSNLKKKFLLLLWKRILWSQRLTKKKPL